MKKVMQPFESHMQYIAQWMCDYNLYGCAYMDCQEIKFRSPVPDFFEMTNTDHHWHDRTIPANAISDENVVQRQSNCSIEVDVCAQNILNRLDVKARPIHHDFVERTRPGELEGKLVNSMAGLWRDETKRRKKRMGLVDSDGSPFPPEVLVTVSADPRNSQPGGWIHEEEFRERIKDIIEEEKSHRDPAKLSFDTFLDARKFMEHVKPLLDSIEDFYPQNILHSTNTQSIKPPAGEQTQAPLPEVDEGRVFSIPEEDFPYDSDEELAMQYAATQKRSQEASKVSSGPSQTKSANSGFSLGTKPPSDPSKGQGPTSSTDLEDLGIRDAFDYDSIEDDAFDVPADFLSDLAGDLPQLSNGTLGPPQKRRKLFGETPSADADAQRGNETDQNTALHGARMKENGNQGSVMNRHSNVNGHQATRDVQGSSFNLRGYTSSNEGSNSKSGNSRLSFPVVKDPQDPQTMLRLSQKSNVTPKGSQLTPKTPISTELLDTSLLFSSARKSSLTSGSSKDSEKASLLVRTCASKLHKEFNIPKTQRILCFPFEPPGPFTLQREMRERNIPSKIYQEAYYSEDKDVPERSREYGGKEFKLESTTVPYLPDFDASGNSPATYGLKPGVVVDRVQQEKAFANRKRDCSLKTWEIAQTPPTVADVQNWLVDNPLPATEVEEAYHDADMLQKGSISQIDAASQKNRHGFKYSQKQKSTSVQHETQYMSIMSLEVHVNTRGNLLPNPEQDEIRTVFWCIQSDDEDLIVNGLNEGTHVGVIALSETGGLGSKISQMADVEVDEESSELDLINRMVDIVRRHDPDILTGYEVHGSSWGYMIERARLKYDYALCDEFSRTMSQSHGRFGKEEDRWGFNQTSTIRITGRHTINIWRAMRGELNLLQYTMENVVFQLCHKRIPHYAFRDLTLWYNSGKPKHLAKVILYYLSRVQLDLEILEKNELVPRISEQARLLGVDFFSVFSRGSQFKVESLMFRIAKPESLLLPSPSRKQVGQQNALECLPLVMEPQSAFYTSPLLVLDFQSLYPSIMIAYNYCYSTFLGRVVNWRGQNKMGFTDYHRQPGLLELFADQINIAPNGIMYAKPGIRKSLLAKMLGEILETRVMVKSGMKVDKNDKTLQRLLNNRQLALKLIANVTYGYTSASFSGRMPCSEIADSIVQTARETLEKAIALIHSVSKWNAEVVYGDTDSLFVYLKGRTKEEAFDIGQDIAKSITDMNPRPVKLKFEKVYFPCVLLAKKRYVGFKYESKTQKIPDFDAKGIETVRRDGTPAEQKIEEKALKMLFRTADLSQVKNYFQRQCAKIMSGRVSIQDFCFAREVKLGTYSDKGLPPPGALISTRKMLEDPRAEPQYGERVPYVVITGAPGARLIDRCVAPEVLLQDDNNELDAEYYISKNLIPPLERIFNLVGANVRQWYDEMPKLQRIRRIDSSLLTTDSDLPISKKTLESYMKSSLCIVCREKLEGGAIVCDGCLDQADASILALQSKLTAIELKTRSLEKVCRSCAGVAWEDEVKCDSKDCPVFYTRIRHTAVSKGERLTTYPIIDRISGQRKELLEW